MRNPSHEVVRIPDIHAAQQQNQWGFQLLKSAALLGMGCNLACRRSRRTILNQFLTSRFLRLLGKRTGNSFEDLEAPASFRLCRWAELDWQPCSTSSTWFVNFWRTKWGIRTHVNSPRTSTRLMYWNYYCPSMIILNWNKWHSRTGKNEKL